MRKTHFSVDPANSLDVACGRTVNDHGQTPFVERVTCGACKNRGEYDRAMKDHLIAKEKSFMAQTPRQYGEPWRDGIIVCQNGHDTFRLGDRTCYGHYDNFVCATCGDVQSRLTETGMSF